MSISNSRPSRKPAPSSSAAPPIACSTSPPDERSRGVITVSTGNHGKAVAYVARKLGVPATICVPEQVLAHKVAAMRGLGADVVTHGLSQDEAEAHAAELSRERGLVWVSAFDDPLIIAGQGTIGLEILEDLPDVDTVVVPLSGGGLISGIALAIKSASAAIRTTGVSMERGPAMVMSLRAGRPVPVVEEPTLADSLMGGIGLENRYTFAMVQRYVDDVVLVSEQEIAAAMAHAVRAEHTVVEGGGAVGIAALSAGKVERLGAAGGRRGQWGECGYGRADRHTRPRVGRVGTTRRTCTSRPSIGRQPNPLVERNTYTVYPFNSPSWSSANWRSPSPLASSTVFSKSAIALSVSPRLR